MGNKKTVTELRTIAREIRKLILDTTYHAGCGHTGGSLSETDILTTLFFRVMNIDPEVPEKIDRDRFILSKGHATPGYYSTLARRGFFPQDVLRSFDELGSILQGHPDMHKIPGVDISSGSLGQGLSCGLGMAMAAEDLGLDFTTFVLMGDGESAEGQIWEAALYAGAENKRVKKLVAILDYNKVQLASNTKDAVDLGDIAKVYKAFGWAVIECDGHDIEKLLPALEQAKKLAESGPVAVIAHTIKGKGVSFMEGKFEWHGKAPNEQEYHAALLELQSTEEK
ncbi:MAG: transketolase [Bacteroidetes bacterium]|nr:transketolase [Bacteroidota bacterium]